MKVLVTGANGFLGQRIVENAASEWEICALVHGSSSLPKSVQALQVDLTDSRDYERLPASVDAIVHLAQSAEYRTFPDGMRDMMAVNVQGTFELLDYARKAGCEHFVYASTGSLYPSGSQSEASQVWPKSAYASTKYCAEVLLLPYSELFATLALRLFFLYGPGQVGMLIPNLIQRVRDGKPVSLHGTEDGMRFCPTYVDDVANAIKKAVELRVTGVTNVASPEMLSLREVVETMAAVLEVTPRFTEDPRAEPPVFAPVLERLSGWYDLSTGFRSFEAGIRSTLGA